MANDGDRVASHWPLIAAGAGCLSLLGLLLAQIIAFTDGRLVYASDDVYIHMALAKNLAFHGVWGITPYAFTSCASSIVWPLLTALSFRLVGLQEWIPLAWNVACTLALLGLLYWDLRRRDRRGWTAFGMLAAYIFFVPLAALVFDGLEHVLQILVFLAFAMRLAAFLEKGSDRTGRFLLVLLAAALTMVRYEGLFLAGAAALLLAWKRDWRLAAMVLAAAALPVAVMGAVSAANGWYPVPTSVLIKSAPFTDIIPETPIMTLSRPFRYLTGRDYMLSIIAVLLALWYSASRKPGGLTTARVAPGIFFLLVAFAHGTLISLEWFYRHAAYLVALGIWAVDAAGLPEIRWRELFSRRAAGLAAGALAVLLAAPLLQRAGGAIANTPAAARNIYEMQIQMAEFLKEAFPADPAAVNDIGAVAYFNEFPVLDLYGLASMDVARAKMQGAYDTAMIARLVREAGAPVVIVYPYWFDRYGGLPEDWVKVAEWRFRDCHVCGGDTVAFYAADPARAAELAEKLAAFRARLPMRVEMTLLQTAEGGPND